MKITLIKQLMIALFGVWMLSSCEYEFIDVGGTPDLTDTISFSAEVEPIFDAAKCTSCHNGGSIAPHNFTAGNAYSNLVDNGLVVPFKPEDSKIYFYPEPGSGEHNTKYSAKQANTVKTWILQGALNN